MPRVVGLPLGDPKQLVQAAPPAASSLPILTWNHRSFILRAGAPSSAIAAPKNWEGLPKGGVAKASSRRPVASTCPLPIRLPVPRRLPRRSLQTPRPQGDGSAARVTPDTTRGRASPSPGGPTRMWLIKHGSAAVCGYSEGRGHACTGETGEDTPGLLSLSTQNLVPCKVGGLMPAP